MQHSSSYTSKVTGKQYNIVCTVNYKSANIIHIIECSVCGLQYVDELKQPFHKHLNGYRSDNTKKSFLPVSMSTTFAVFVSTGVTLAYSCARLGHLCPHQQDSHTVWLFEGNHGRRRKDIVLFGFFFDGCPMLTNGVEAVS
jgi:hypothetical protein